MKALEHTIVLPLWDGKFEELEIVWFVAKEVRQCEASPVQEVAEARR